VWQLAILNAPPRTLNTGWVQYMTCSEDGKLVLTLGDSPQRKIGNGNEEARLWNTESGLPRVNAAFKHDLMTFAALSPNGQWIATAGAGGNGQPPEVWIWNVANPDKKIVLLTKGAAAFLAFSPDGKHLLTASAESGSEISKQRLRLWDVATGAA